MASSTTAKRSSKPDDIRWAAQRLFLRYGFSGTSMDAIANEARVSKQTVYRYYESKSQLFSAVLGEAANAPHTVIRQMTQQSPPMDGRREEVLMAVARQILDHLLDPTYIDLLRVVLGESRQFPELPHRLRASVIDPGTEALGDILRSSALADSADHEQLDAARRLFVGPLLSYLLEAMMSDPLAIHRTAVAELPTIIRLFMHAVPIDG